MRPENNLNHVPVTNTIPISHEITSLPRKSIRMVARQDQESDPTRENSPNDFIEKAKELYDELVRRLVKLTDKYMDEWAYENTLEMLQNPTNLTEKLFSVAITIISQYAALEEDKPVSDVLLLQYITHIQDMVEQQMFMCHDMLMGLVGNKDRVLGFFADLKL
ncbi:hypothetical protein EX30DRAFT_351945 [Ascodesmis nigricans]|uniref:Uncharacterized protein n=1 Tax=Ascodesmis nigricans TaxID=341454 RepID=A0A4S2MRB1_9PEZI|nr:hypothetical protein EX30DRAFT_351945 [Ascodesmis nigricans]